jgi:hypothetical protein
MAARSSQPSDSNDGHSNAERRDSDATLGTSQRECGVAVRLPGGSGALSQTAAQNGKVRRNYADVSLNTTSNCNKVVGLRYVMSTDEPTLTDCLIDTIKVYPVTCHEHPQQ